MPVDRFFHPRAGHSRKICALSDFEFRVWWTYEMAADDYGVMRASPVVLQAANARLADSPPKRVMSALARLIEVGLVAAFTHQGTSFVCQLDWQDFQKVRYPRESLEPAPPSEILEKCSGSTQELFRQRFRRISEKDPNLPRTGAREEANAKGNGQRQTADADGAAERLSDAFRARWKAAYGVECSLILKPLEFMQLSQQIAAHGEAQLLRSLDAYFASGDEFVRKARHPLPIWLRDPLKHLAKDAAVAPSRPRGCRHEPACADDADHTKRDLAERRLA